MEICPKCERPLKSINQWHNCVVMDLDTLFAGKALILQEIFEKVLAEVSTWEGVEISATQNCIVFLRNKTFLIIKPMKSQLNVKFYLTERQEGEPFHSSALWGSKWEHNIRVAKPQQIEGFQVLRWLRQSYEIS